MITKGILIHAVALSVKMLDLGNPAGYQVAGAFLRYLNLVFCRILKSAIFQNQLIIKNFRNWLWENNQ